MDLVVAKLIASLTIELVACLCTPRMFAARQATNAVIRILIFIFII